MNMKIPSFKSVLPVIKLFITREFALYAIIVSMLALGNFWLWWAMNRSVNPSPWHGIINSVSFSPYQKGQSPHKEIFPSPDEMESDLKLLQGMVSTIRTYSSTKGIEEVPRLAGKYNLQVNAGAWLDKRKENNELEIQNLIRSVQENPNVERVIVGNEAILRGDLTVQELAGYLQRVRNEVNVPVSTAEPWHVWIKNKELANYVDYISIHVLPYWEGVPFETALDWVMARYHQVKRTFPGKHVFISEVGWPSAGSKMERSSAGLVHEAVFIREFLKLASQHQLDYSVIEAFDQDWKPGDEGFVGAHWGLFDVKRRPKFSFTGPVYEYPLWSLQALLASLLATSLMVFFIRRWKDKIQQKGFLYFGMLVQGGLSLLVWTAFFPVNIPLSDPGFLVWFILIPAQLVLVAVILINGFEMTELLWNKGLKRLFFPIEEEGSHSELPMVSLHLPICNEPPEMVIKTLNSLKQLDYPNFEVLVLDNNTRDPGSWLPVERHCRALGQKFRFFHLGKWHGFKAGALNFALKNMNPEARIIGVLDSDYIVDSNWLNALVPHFENPRVGFVQAPQDHREWEKSPFNEMCNWEYNGFFHIGMVHRNERNAIIQHGTMTLIRKEALKGVGGWAECCICEDAELGLRLFHEGYEAVYVNKSFGKGLTPDTFEAYKKQRFRWAYGAVQILKRHWRWMLPFQKEEGAVLSLGQRYHFLSGWLPWFGDAAHLVFTVVSILWTLGLVLLPKYFELSLTAMVMPAASIFLFKGISSAWLYKKKVPSCTWRQIFLASIAGTSLTHTIGLAMIKGLFISGQPFLRTPKCESRPLVVQSLMMARDELILFGLLLFSAFNVLLHFSLKDTEVLVWFVLLLIQSLSYGAAVGMSMANIIPGIKVPVFVQGFMDALKSELQERFGHIYL